MIDYFFEARIGATVSVSGNLARTLGIALAHFHREQSQKIQRLESSSEQGREYMAAIAKCELREFEQWQAGLEKLMAAQRASQAEFEANTNDVHHGREVAA